MKIDENDILSYYLGETEEPDSTNIRNAIENDPALQPMAEKCRRVAAGFRRMRLDGFLEEARALEAEIEETPEPGKHSGGGRWWGLGVLALAGVIAGLLLVVKPSYQLAHIVQDLLVVPENPALASAEATSDFWSGVDAFHRQGDFRAANAFFARVSEDTLYGARSRYYLPLTNFRLEEYATANQRFGALMDRETEYDYRLLEDLEWNHWLSEFVLGRAAPDTAPDHPKREELMEVTDSFWYRVFN